MASEIKTSAQQQKKKGTLRLILVLPQNILTFEKSTRWADEVKVAQYQWLSVVTVSLRDGAAATVHTVCI